MSRRRFLSRLLGVSAAAGLGLRPRHAPGAPALVQGEDALPRIPYGTAAGDVEPGRAVVWSRADRPARMVVEWDTAESFRHARRVVGPLAREQTGLTARVDLEGLPPGQRIVYRVHFEDVSAAPRRSAPAEGSFLSCPADRRDLTLAWSADTVGQGWGIDRERGGMRLYETMRRAQPDLFIHCGDTVYADGPLAAEVRLDDGTLWRNLVTPAKAKVAETLDEFRGNHLYNMLDDNVRRFNAEVAQVALWDDHEVRNNWYPGQLLEDARYTERRVSVLAARARQAFLEHTPLRLHAGGRIHRRIAYGPLLDVFALDLRTWRGRNSANRQTRRGRETDLFGLSQLTWLEQALAGSRAVWKVVASDLPLGLIVPDGPQHFEAFANGEGPPLGRELELAHLLRSLRDRGVGNVVWITGDVHYAAAHHYDPQRARFPHFQPFWEFVAGPAHAGTFGPNPLDDTFGPEVRFLAIPPGLKPNRPPSEGHQFFGTLRIDGRSEVMTVRLHDLSGRALYTVELPSAPRSPAPFRRRPGRGR